ncbi:hypothetical protein K8P02_00520 [Bacteroides nordii]|uniref:hypothetical protein n=1 Tax=Bacteroides nordii TaxID=291645 RepID=UPI000471C4C7|nr:hypothetical protein [Bacteroides nordii]UAK42811.1 hypothetical protein K8P02_00520 [Bacteroides nordii]
MREKASTLTLRLYADEAAQLEIVKQQVGKQTGSEAIKYVIREYPRFCAHYKQQAKEWQEKERKYQEQEWEIRELKEALKVVMKFIRED